MQTPLIDVESEIKHFQKLSRQALVNADVFAISVIGGPGCGKSTLIDQTIKHLMPDVHVGVIACDPESHRDADVISRYSKQVVQLNTTESGALYASQIYDALNLLDLNWIDLLFIENVGSLVGTSENDIGQDVTAAIFSVAAGDDKAAKHPTLVNSADIVLLNKIDLLTFVPFDRLAFRNDVRRLNEHAEVIEVSGLRANGIDAWVKWLKKRLSATQQHVSHWFG